MDCAGDICSTTHDRHKMMDTGRSSSMRVERSVSRSCTSRWPTTSSDASSGELVMMPRATKARDWMAELGVKAVAWVSVSHRSCQGVPTSVLLGEKASTMLRNDSTTLSTVCTSVGGGVDLGQSSGDVNGVMDAMDPNPYCTNDVAWVSSLM